MIIDTSPYKLIPEPVAPALPAAGQSFTDPNFGTTLVRLTDEKDGTINRISYGIWSAFSCDYTKVLIQCDALFKIKTWHPATMDGFGEIKLPASFQGSDAIWSHTDPNRIFHRDGGSRLMLMDVTTGEDQVIHDFAADFPDSPFLARMSGSANDDVFCFARQTTRYVPSGFCVYTRSTGAIYREPPSRAGDAFKVQIDKTGRYMWNVATDPLSEWWDLSLPNTQQDLPNVHRVTPGTGHSAMLTSDIAQYNNDTNCDELMSLDTPLIKYPTIYWPDWSLATEYSGTDADETRYAVTAAFNPAAAAAANPPIPAQGPLHNELLLVSTDGSGTVQRLCHMHNVMTADYGSIPQPATGYGAQPWISFHSSWGDSGRRDVFLVKTSESQETTTVTKSIWYRASTCWWGTLANPISQPTEVANLDRHFAQFAADGYNCVSVMVPDDNGWPQGYGAGFPYNPVANPRPDLAKAMDLLLARAAAAGLKVIFALAPSEYHLMVDDTYGSPGGMFAFIHYTIDPSACPGYAGCPCFIGDARIAGWMFCMEPELAGTSPDIVAAWCSTFDKYFGFFKFVVHYGGATCSWAGSYAPAGPDRPVADAVAMISALAAYQPDILGFESYYDAPASFPTLIPNLMALFTAVKAAVPSIPPAKWFLGEVGTNQPDSTAKHGYFMDVVRVCNEFGVGGLALWQSDGLSNIPGDLKVQDQELYALYEGTFTKAGQINPPGAPVPWRYFAPPVPTPANPYTTASCYAIVPPTPYATAYGQIDYAPNACGEAASAALKNT